MSEQKFDVIDRPKRARGVRITESRNTAIAETLATGRAVSVPINGETYAVVRNRVAASAALVAKKRDARLLTQPNADRTAVVLWLEPKA